MPTWNARPHPGHRLRRLRPLARRAVGRGGGRTAARLRPRRQDRARRRSAGRDRHAGPPRPARPPCCSTPTTTSSRSATACCGSPTRSSRSSGTAASTAGARPTTRPASWRTSRRCARSATTCPVGVVALHRGRGGVRLRLAGASCSREYRDEIAVGRHRDRRLRQLGHRRAGADHLAARHRQLLRRGPHAGPRRPQWHVRRRGAGRADRAGPAARHPARRRRRRGRRGPGRPGRRRRWTTRRTGSARRPACSTACSSSVPAGSSTGSGPSPRSPCSASTPRPPARRRTRWSRRQGQAQRTARARRRPEEGVRGAARAPGEARPVGRPGRR